MIKQSLLLWRINQLTNKTFKTNLTINQQILTAVVPNLEGTLESLGDLKKMLMLSLHSRLHIGAFLKIAARPHPRQIRYEF